MKKIRNSLLFLIFVLSVIVVGCGNNKTQLSESEKTVKIGQSFDLTVDAKDVTWISSDSSVASVDSGKVTGIKEGKAVISAVCGEETLSCTVMVENAYYPVIQIVNKVSTLYLGHDYEMSAEIMLGNKVVTSDLEWKSSNEKVVTIDENGKAHTVALGKTVLTVCTTYEGIYIEDSAEVVVAGLNYIEAPDKIELGLYAGDATYKLDYTVYLDNKATEETAVITSKDSSIVKVENNVLKSVAEGETVVTLVYDSDVDKISIDIPISVKRHILHTFTEENESYYTGDYERNGGSTIGDYWATVKPTVVTTGSLDGKNGTGTRVWAYYWDPAFSFSLDLTKQELQSYLKKGYTKVVVPVYTSSKYADRIQLECAGFLSNQLPADGWKEVEFPLDAFIDYYNEYKVKGAAIIRYENCWATDAQAIGEEVEFYVYYGDIYLR